MNTLIEVTARSVYGRILLDPANEQARLLARIVGTATLSTGTLHLARGMGFDIRVSGDQRHALKLQEEFK